MGWRSGVGTDATTVRSIDSRRQPHVTMSRKKDEVRGLRRIQPMVQGSRQYLDLATFDNPFFRA